MATFSNTYQKKTISILSKTMKSFHTHIKNIEKFRYKSRSKWSSCLVLPQVYIVTNDVCYCYHYKSVSATGLEPAKTLP